MIDEEGLNRAFPHHHVMEFRLPVGEMHPWEEAVDRGFDRVTP
jgi:hypothetical protein